MQNNFRATYRVQLHAGFTLNEAADIAGYLSRLGISHLYCSPYLQAAPGSTHGYDIVNHHQVNQELGGEPARQHLLAALKQNGLGQVLDIVPNHMAIIGSINPWWWNVLENGPSSRYAAYFDVDWDPAEARHSNEVLVPVLGDHYGRVIEAGEVHLQFKDGVFTLHYFDHVFPVNPRSLGSILASAAERCASDTLAFLGESFDHLPHSNVTDRSTAQRRGRDQMVLGNLLQQLCRQKPETEAAIQAVVAELNADPDALDVLLELQNYRLAFWRITRRELGYRRFFDIQSLIGLRIEDEQVLRDTHHLIFEWLRQGQVDGLRIDHPDGLRDPGQYFQRLYTLHPNTWIVIEKILEPGEEMPGDWPVAGTTGYDFIHRVNGLFIDSDHEEVINTFYTRFTGQSTDYAAITRQKKLLVLDQVLGSDVNRLTALLLEICERHRRYRDYTRPELRQALCELAACLPVYRTYVVATGKRETSQVSEIDRAHLQQAAAAAKRNLPDLDPLLFDFLQGLLAVDVEGDVEAEFVMRFQQFTGPAMAKGVEDTTFYLYNRLVSLNEVVGNPGQFGVSIEEFHRACQETARRWPLSMLATSTHDTKRSEDVRARLNVLSEIPDEWAAAVERWAELNAPHRSQDFPDRNDEYLLYQTLVGAWPLETERILQYMEKAGREAKLHTSWTDPNPVYEKAVAGFVQAALSNPVFVADLESFVARVLEPGRINSLAQTLIKLTSPGIPDLYQGTELWNLSLVDPDNRRPVDYDLRRRLLAELETGPTPESVLQGMEEGLPKLWVIHQALSVRKNHPELFAPGASYTPIEVSSEFALAFARQDTLVTVVPRFSTCKQRAWEETQVQIPPGEWKNVLTHETVPGGSQRLGHLLAHFPVCLLLRSEVTR